MGGVRVLWNGSEEALGKPEAHSTLRQRPCAPRRGLCAITQKLAISENGQGPVQAQPQAQGRMGLPQSTRQPDMPSLREGMRGERALLHMEISGNRLEMNLGGNSALRAPQTHELRRKVRVTRMETRLFLNPA